MLSPIMPNAVAISGACHTDIAGPSGDFRIFTFAPQRAAPAGGHPVIYALDGNAHFLSAIASVKAQGVRPEMTGLDPAVVVGIGYPVEAEHDLLRRTLDYTPAVAPEKLGRRPDSQPWEPTGGAEALIGFIEDSVKPLIAARHDINPARQSLFGHSYGGLFTLYTALTRPALYNRYLVSSPSIWFAERHVLSFLDGFESRLREAGGRRSMIVSTGSLEEYVSPAVRAAQPDYAEWVQRNAMNSNARLLAEKLAPIPAELLDFSHHEIEGEHHGSVPPMALHLAMRLALKR